MAQVRSQSGPGKAQTRTRNMIKKKNINMNVPGIQTTTENRIKNTVNPPKNFSMVGKLQNRTSMHETQHNPNTSAFNTTKAKTAIRSAATRQSGTSTTRMSETNRPVNRQENINNQFKAAFGRTKFKRAVRK